MAEDEDKDLIAIGKIERPFGVRGEVRVRSLSDVPGRFEGLKEVTLVTGAGQRMATTVNRVRQMGHVYVLGFEGIETPEQAAEFRGSLIKIPHTLTPPSPPGQYYEFELLGTTVVDESGSVLGTLEEIFETPGNHVFVVRGEDGESLLPATKEVVRAVDLDARRTTVRWVAAVQETADAV